MPKGLGKSLVKSSGNLWAGFGERFGQGLAGLGKDSGKVQGRIFEKGFMKGLGRTQGKA